MSTSGVSLETAAGPRARSAVPVRTWSRSVPLAGRTEARRRETWTCRAGDRVLGAFDIEVMVGKDLDVAALKGGDLDEIRCCAERLGRTAARLYGDAAGRVAFDACPCCLGPIDQAEPAAAVLGAVYRRCPACRHVFVGAPPDPAALEAIYKESEALASTYTDPDRCELRLEQVVGPKLDWVRRVYQDHAGRPARSVIDVGAGGGHFVEACARAGLDAAGYEISEACRGFSRSVFGRELIARDFREDAGRPADVVSFWGLLEYTLEPRSFLEAARRRLEPDSGLLVVEVPRFDCLGTAAQLHGPGAIVRHLDPTSHVHCFSDESLATALLDCGFRPVAAWYFGMDVWELLVQLAVLNDDVDLIDRTLHLVPGLQACVDHALCCDDLILAAVPLDHGRSHGKPAP